MSRRAAAVALALIALLTVGFYLLGGGTGEGQAEYEPEGHFRTLNAANPDAAEAERLYQSIVADMAAHYAQADEPAARAYRSWTRFNTAPYKSKTHGDRFVNNYGNGLAEAYREVKSGRPMPPGAILAKDAFAVTEDGDVYAQSLFLMEKLPEGASPDTGDWRYVMITPAGEVYGDTRGETPEKAAFCHDCHRTVQRSDYLFYVPEAYRALR